MTAPNKEQALAGQAASLAVRQARAELKVKLKRGEVSFREAWESEVAQGMKVIDLLAALPGVAPKRAHAILGWVAIPTSNTVRKCGPKQTGRLFQVVEASVETR